MTNRLDRRRFLAASAAAALEMSAAAAKGEGATSVSRPAAFNAPRPLPFDPAKIKGLSEKLLVSH
jgi:Fe-Mn family superoxide dismutase